jgi:hypothetical protein
MGKDRHESAGPYTEEKGMQDREVCVGRIAFGEVVGSAAGFTG